MEFRQENDSLGLVRIPKDKMWGAVTQRALQNFQIGRPQDRMPIEIIHALALVKKCAAQVNAKLGLLNLKKAQAIQQAADEIIKGQWDEHFPLPVWQTGSGTASHMNVNEVIANRAIQILGGQIGDKTVHPNDDVNKGQSSNDVFPAAMHICAAAQTQKLLSALQALIDSLNKKSKEFADLIKPGRTHLMDAAPLTLGQEFSGWFSGLQLARTRLQDALNGLRPLALGGTAVGTGLNAHPDFAPAAAALIAKETSFPFTQADNLFAASSMHNELLILSGALKTVACILMKSANDIRFLGSGPRAGLNELILPANEPGSSIMPGKTNPTQAEALTMVCAEVISCDTAAAIGCMNGHFQLNTFKPLIIFNILRPLHLLTGGVQSFNKHCVSGLKANPERLKKNLHSSLMLATALNPHIGYDQAAQITKAAFQNNTTLKEEAVRLGFLTAEEFDQFVQPQNMIAPSSNKKT